MIDPSRHAQNKGWLESMAQKIPGFGGYLEMEDRRESDHLVRKWMADRLQQSKRGLDETIRQLVDTGNLDALSSWERVRTRLDGFINKIRGAERGYSGFFGFVKVNEDVLAQVYNSDLVLVEDIRALAEQLEKPGDGMPQAAAELTKRIDAVESLFAKRGEILKGMAPS